MPPKAASEAALAAFVPPLLLLVVVPLELLDELQATVSSRLPAIATPAAIACPDRNFPPRNRSSPAGEQGAGSWLDKSDHG
jgi:hypothetical protein